MGGNDDDYFDYDELVAAEDDWYGRYDEEGGFDNYTPRTEDPGQVPFVVTFLYFSLLIFLFPLFIALRQRLKKWRMQQQESKKAAQGANDCVVKHAPAVAPLDVATGVSVESLYIEVSDGLTTLNTRQCQNQILILSSKLHPVRASKRHAVGTLLQKTGTPTRHAVGTIAENKGHPLRRFVQRWGCRSSQSSVVHSSSTFKKNEQLMAVPETTEESEPNEDFPARIVVYQPVEEKGSSDSSEVQSSKEGDASESDGLMEAVIRDFVDDIKLYDDENEVSGTQPDSAILLAGDSPTKYKIDVYNGKRPFFVYFCSKGFHRKVKKCAAWDYEMGKILKLAAPFTLHAIATDVCYFLEVVVISQLLGTSALSAYFSVGFMVALATMVIHGAMSSLNILCSQAIGAANAPLAGRYVQISILFHQMIVIPLIVLGWDRFDDVVEWVGFHEGTGEEALKYARFIFFVEAISVYDDGIHYILEAIDQENYSSVLIGSKSVFSWLMVFCVIRFHNSPELWMVGAVHVAMTILFLSINITIVVQKRWLDGYWQGLAGSVCISDTRAIITFFRTALPLSLGYVIESCEWEILFIFASVQGPAEVAVWGLLGSIWGVSENIGVAVADAAEIRVANLLGRGKPAEARHSAHKSILIGTMTSVLMSLAILSVSDVLPRWVTPDETLQAMFRELLPQMCLGLAVLTFGTMSWSILCAQGRSSIAAVMCLVGSLGVSLPCALVSTLVLNYNLHGLLTSVVLGYATSSVLVSICMVSTNWKKLADKVRRRNKLSENGDASDCEGTVVEQTDEEESCTGDLEYEDYKWSELPGEGKTTQFISSRPNALHVQFERLRPSLDILKEYGTTA